MSFLPCVTLTDHIENQCNTFKKGGFKSIAILEKDHGITDFTNASQWTTAINDGKARLINRIKGELTEPSEQKVDNPVACGAEQILDGFDWSFEWMDANVNAANDSFYETLNLKDSYLVVHNCTEEELLIVQKSVVFSCKPVAPASNKELQRYVCKASWSSKPNEFPTRVTAPAGIFATT